VQLEIGIWLRVVRDRNWYWKKRKNKRNWREDAAMTQHAQERNWKLKDVVEIQGIDRNKTYINQRLER
jgi:hypothetical protein